MVTAELSHPLPMVGFMGTRNRERRRQKRIRARSAPPRARRSADPFDVEGAIGWAVAASGRPGHSELRDAVSNLAAGPPDLIDTALGRRLAGAVSAVRQRGWEVAEVRRVVKKRLGALPARTLDELRPWGDDRVAALVAAVAVLDLLARLPALPRVGSGARRAPSVDRRVLERVRALLAKAESTTFPEEAEALSSKAQQLMARHSIDRALLDATNGRGTAGSRRLGVDDPYAGPKSLLVAVVADANRCSSVWSKEFGFVTVFGGDDDVDAVELLYTSLLCQAASAMNSAARAGGRSRSFRHAFLVAYANRIGSRLADATATATADAVDEHGSDRLLPVLAARADAAEDAAREAFPNMRSVGFSARDAAGWAAGIAAADRAQLDREVGMEGPGAPAGALRRGASIADTL